MPGFAVGDLAEEVARSLLSTPSVVLDPLGRSLGPADAELRLFVARDAWTALDD